MAKCGNWQDVFSIQAEWIRDASDDYAKEIGKLMEVNGRIVSDAYRSVEEAAAQSAERVTKTPMNVSS
jgi:hypothetical protein